MKDERKTKKQLVAELVKLRQQLAERKQAEKALEKHNRALQALHEVTLDIGAELRMSALLRDIMERAADLLDADRGGGVYLYDADENVLRLVEGTGINKGRAGAVVQVHEGMAGRVFRTSQPFIIGNYTHWAERAVVLVADPPSIVMGVPLLLQGQVIGVLGLVANSHRRTFNQQDVQLAEMFAAQAVVAIQNARLSEQAQQEIAERVQAEARVEHLNTVLCAIRNVNQIIVREKDRDRLLQSACDNLIKTRGYHSAWIALLNEAGALVTAAEAGCGEDFVPLVEQLKCGELTVCGRRAMEQPDVVVTADPPSACAGCPLSASYGGRGAMTVRLEHGGKVYGLSSVSIPAHFIADEDERALFGEVAGDIAFALHNIELEEERVRAEELLRESEERYRAVVEYQTDLIRRFLPDGTLTFVNQAYCRCHGQERQELVGHSFMSYILPEEREMVAQHLASFSREKPVATMEHRAVVVGGKVRWQQWINRPIFDAQGNVIEFQAVGRDVTERKQAEEALRESEEKYRTILESIEDGYYEVDLAGNLVFFNDSLCKILGYSPDELTGLNNRKFMDDETAGAVYQTFNEVYQTRKPVEAVDWELVRKDKDTRLIEASVSLMSDPTGEPIGFRGVARDITERKQMEQQLRQQERLAAVGQLAGGIAHDFNNMLTVVMLYAHQLLRREQPYARTVSAAETIIEESKRATKLVGQILDFSRRSHLETSPLDLKPFIKEAIHILERTIPENIHLHFDARAEEYATPFTIKGDPTRIQQVLMNLVVNARDAMPEGGELRIELAGIELRPGDVPPVIEMAPGEWICLSVSDTGTGIPPHALGHIFEPFFTTKEPGKGTGLGLAQVYGIVAQHGGHIGVETEMGQGTTFRVYLPASREKEEVTEEEASAIPQGQGETILLVEDNENLRKGGRDLLELLGYRVMTGANGREALEICQAVKGIDLVITDIVMPKMGGKQLMQELGRTIPALKVLALTGYAMEKSREELKEAGFLDVVYKPFDVDNLAHVIRWALGED